MVILIAIIVIIGILALLIFIFGKGEGTLNNRSSVDRVKGRIYDQYRIIASLEDSSESEDFSEYRFCMSMAALIESRLFDVIKEEYPRHAQAIDRMYHNGEYKYDYIAGLFFGYYLSLINVPGQGKILPKDVRRYIDTIAVPEDTRKAVIQIFKMSPVDEHSRAMILNALLGDDWDDLSMFLQDTKKSPGINISTAMIDLSSWFLESLSKDDKATELVGATIKTIKG